MFLAICSNVSLESFGSFSGMWLAAEDALSSPVVYAAFGDSEPSASLLLFIWAPLPVGVRTGVR